MHTTPSPVAKPPSAQFEGFTNVERMAGGIIHLEKTTILSHPHAPALYNRMTRRREIDVAVMNFFVTDAEAFHLHRGAQ
jgi:hypothetical protein